MTRKMTLILILIAILAMSLTACSDPPDLRDAARAQDAAEDIAEVYSQDNWVSDLASELIDLASE